jgi:hypothetical protein
VLGDFCFQGLNLVVGFEQPLLHAATLHFAVTDVTLFCHELILEGLDLRTFPFDVLQICCGPLALCSELAVTVGQVIPFAVLDVPNYGHLMLLEHFVILAKALVLPLKLGGCALRFDAFPVLLISLVVGLLTL